MYSLVVIGPFLTIFTSAPTTLSFSKTPTPSGNCEVKVDISAKFGGHGTKDLAGVGEQTNTLTNGSRILVWCHKKYLLSNTEKTYILLFTSCNCKFCLLFSFYVVLPSAVVTIPVEYICQGKACMCWQHQLLYTAALLDSNLKNQYGVSVNEEILTLLSPMLEFYYLVNIQVIDKSL